MERLTEWRGEHAAVVNNHANYIDRLAAYEDAGLEPEQVKDMAENAETMLLTWFESRYGFPVGTLMGLLEAKQEGRLVVLPCRVEDYVYIPSIEKSKVVRVRVQGISISLSSRPILRFGGYPFESAWGDRCGKDWFLTREEAEAALAKVGKGDG